MGQDSWSEGMREGGEAGRERAAASLPRVATAATERGGLRGGEQGALVLEGVERAGWVRWKRRWKRSADGPVDIVCVVQ